MNLKELNYIVTIADEGSISRAAEKLYMAQSSLSQFLQLYEAELGAPLFMRTSRGVRPTASGSVFLNHARQILLQYHRAQSELWDIEELSGGRIELGIRPSGALICCRLYSSGSVTGIPGSMWRLQKKTVCIWRK